MKLSRKISIPKTATCASLHKNGGHILVGSDVGKVYWFDIEITSKPIKILNYHTSTVQEVQFHPKKSVFVSCAEDGSVVLSHGKIFE